jgi:hypothetical protein
MTRRSEEESSKWEQLQKNFDTMFSQMNEMSTVQKQMKDRRIFVMQPWMNTARNIILSHQVLANGATITKMTLKQMDEAAVEDNKPHFDQDPTFDAAEVDSLIFPEQETFQNIFADPKHDDRKEPSRLLRTDYGYTAKQDHQDKAKNIAHPPRGRDREEDHQYIPKHAMPEMEFPDFHGSDPKVWLDNCRDYFALYKIPEGMWIPVARMHLKGNAGK